MSNGTVMGRAGSAAVAMVASSHRKPVIVCCESFKFHERVQLDAITHNELGDPDVLAAIPGQPDTQRPLVGWRVSVFVCSC
jgi:translation initiation factor eIF-2B subunit delta